jgi:hypothetical protein
VDISARIEPMVQRVQDIQDFSSMNLSLLNFVFSGICGYIIFSVNKHIKMNIAVSVRLQQ